MFRGGRCWNSSRTTQITNIIFKQYGYTTNASEGYQRRSFVFASDWAGRDMYLVLACEIIEANRYESPVDFLQILAAIDLHEESRFIAEGIFTNSISLAQSRLAIHI